MSRNLYAYITAPVFFKRAVMFSVICKDTTVCCRSRILENYLNKGMNCSN